MGSSNNTGFNVNYALTNGCNPPPNDTDIEYLCQLLVNENKTATYVLVQITDDPFSDAG